MSSGERLVDIDVSFPRGMKSDSDPGILPLGHYFSSINTVNTGGIIACRPGYRCLVKLPQGKLQGAFIFRPQSGLEQMLIAIAGVIYVSSWPFLNFTFLTNILFSPHAKQIFFVQTTQTAERRTTDLNSAIRLIPARDVVFMQDGGSTAPAFYDGTTSGHIRDRAFETPIGSSMQWIGDRLWVANGTQLLASDISNPFSFRESQYLGGTTGLSFTREITAMVASPSLDLPQLIVFTDTTMSIVQADIRDRSRWPLTDGFQREVFKVGCMSQRSLVSHFGRLSWMSASGVVLLDTATVSKLSARIPIRDNELLISKLLLPEDLSLVAGAAFGQFMLMSVPATDLFNLHTWVLNNATLETLNEDASLSWSSIWLGTRPVEWVYGVIMGAERIFHVSTDDDGENRLWEAFTEERLDNGCPIMWSVATRGYFGPSSPIKKLPGDDCRFAYADIGLVCVEEDMDIGVFYAGGLRGAYKSIMNKKISVERGSICSPTEICATTQICGWKPQVRVLRTEDANQKSNEDETGSCPVERPELEALDDSFQLLVVCHGPGSIRYIRAFAFTAPTDLSGDDKACEDENPFNGIRFDGAGVRAGSYDALVAQLDAKPSAQYFSHQTASVSQGSFTAVGVGDSESVVNQRTADRVAAIIARKAAEAELNSVLSRILSGTA